MSEGTVNPPAAADPSVPPPVASVEAVPLTSLVPPVPATEDIKRVPMGRLSAIEIHDYRAHRGTFRLAARPA